MRHTHLLSRIQEIERETQRTHEKKTATHKRKDRSSQIFHFSVVRLQFRLYYFFFFLLSSSFFLLPPHFFCSV
jgi:hypothetical protein